mmetsp:Transcript_3273/g.7706  ORF Transcript_3273/g.7706 Transcript_3273/m.7706 type:complete len:87 (+) Transcript_3273:186-446(+)
MLDLKIQQRLRKLIDEATVKNCPAVDLSLAKEIKQIVKASPELVSSAYQVLISRLGTKHCQVNMKETKAAQYFVLFFRLTLCDINL